MDQPLKAACDNISVTVPAAEQENRHSGAKSQQQVHRCSMTDRAEAAHRSARRHRNPTVVGQLRATSLCDTCVTSCGQGVGRSKTCSRTFRGAGPHLRRPPPLLLADASLSRRSDLGRPRNRKRCHLDYTKNFHRPFSARGTPARSRQCLLISPLAGRQNAFFNEIDPLGLEQGSVQGPRSGAVWASRWRHRILSAPRRFANS